MTKLVRKMECDAAELRALLEAGTPCSLVDVREYPEYAAGRVAEARLMPLGEIERVAGELDRDIPVYVICRSGRRSAIAQQTLQALGFEKVYNVRGGMLDWQSRGFAVVRDERAPWSLERQVRLVAGLLVFAAVVLGITVAQPFLWIAAFVGAGLMFAAVTDSCAMGVVLARLPWNRYAARRACPVERALAEE